MKKSRFDIKKTSRASVSIMLSFLMLPVYTFGAAVADSVRISSAKTMAAGASDIAADAGLSDFNGVLKDVYGLFAASSTEKELEENLNDYFYRTINNTALTEDDAQSRKYISSLADIFSDPSKADFKNLVSLNTESFNAEYTEGAVLANPEVLKSQITEYMKYSGPLKMSSGILNKVGAFRDFSKQNKAITAKIEYDKSLEKINKKCVSVWKSASDYNSFIASGSFSGSLNAADNEKQVRDIYKNAVSVMYLVKYSEDTYINTDKQAEKDVKDTASSENKSVMQAAADKLNGYVASDNGNDSGFMSEIRNIAASSDFDHVRGIHSKSDELNKVSTYCEMYKKQYGKLSDAEKKANQSFYDRVYDLSSLMDKTASDARFIRDAWKTHANAYCGNAADILSNFCTSADEAIAYLEDTKDGLEDILRAIDAAEKAGQNWKTAISALSEGDVKASMQNEYNNDVKSLNKNDISDYLTVTEKNLNAFRNLRGFAEGLKFHGETVCQYIDYSSVFVPVLCDRAVYSQNDTPGAADAEVSAELISTVKPGNETYTEQGNSYKFYKYINDTYGNTAVSQADKKSAKELLKTMKDLGDPSKISQNTPAAAKTDLRSKISDEKLNAISAYLAVPAAGESFTASGGDTDAEQALENSEALQESTGAYMSQISDLASESIEDLLLSEYIMQMFSCYTSETECSGGKVNTVTPQMMSGVQMNEQNNVFYRSEAEYILWGNEDMEKNLAYTRALIFGTRFSLNSVYAFTDSEIRTVTTTAATAIAGWTGFGIPVVKTVLILSLALSESVIDLNKLLAGGEVPVYKNSSTWNMKPSGIVNALKNNSDEIVKMASAKAGKQVEDIFGKLEGAAENGVDELTNTVNSYVDEFANETIDSAVNTVNNVLFASALSVIDGAEQNMSKENIKKLLLENLDSIDTSGSDLGSAAAAELKKLAEAKADEFAVMISSAASSSVGSTKEKTEQIKQNIAEQIKNTVDSLRNPVKNTVDNVGKSVKEIAKNGIGAACECAEDYAKDLVGNMVTGATTALTDKFGNVNINASKKAPSAASAITLTYKEYLRLFLMLGTLSEEKERAMLSRTAILIDVNMNNGLKNASAKGYTLTPSGSFDISKAASMVTVDAEVSVNTILPGIIIPNSAAGGSGTSNNGITDRTKNISVRTVLSY